MSSLSHVRDKPSNNKGEKLEAVHIGDVLCELNSQEIMGKMGFW